MSDTLCSPTHTLTHSLTHTLTHSLTHTHTHSSTHTLNSLTTITTFSLSQFFPLNQSDLPAMSTIDQLCPAMLYEIQVQSLNTNGPSGWSNSLLVRTPLLGEISFYVIFTYNSSPTNSYTELPIPNNISVSVVSFSSRKHHLGLGTVITLTPPLNDITSFTYNVAYRLVSTRASQSIDCWQANCQVAVSSTSPDLSVK